MKKIKVFVSTNRVGSKCEREIEVEDDATEDDINDAAWECACEMIDFNWVEVSQ